MVANDYVYMDFYNVAFNTVTLQVGNAEMTEKITALTTQLRDAETEISRKSCEYTQAQAQYQAAARVLEDNIALRTADLHNSRERYSTCITEHGT